MRVLSFGEILWDIIEGDPYIGGAPFNFAAHLAKMGVASAMITSVGLDNLGAEAIAAAKRLGVDARFITRRPDLPTGTVDVVLRSGGSPSYVIHDNTAWDAITLDQTQGDHLGQEEWDFLCFGTLAQRTEHNRALLAHVLAAARPKEVLYDVNLRQNFFRKEWIEQSLRACSVLKLNGEEADVLSEMLFDSTMDFQPFSEAVSKEYDIPVVCVTLGEEGAAIFDHGRNAWVPGTPISVVDTVGAGDAFAAAFVFSLLYEKTAVEATYLACRVGAWVASQRGAVPEYSDEIERQLERVRTGPVVKS